MKRQKHGRAASYAAQLNEPRGANVGGRSFAEICGALLDQIRPERITPELRAELLRRLVDRRRPFESSENSSD